MIRPTSLHRAIRARSKSLHKLILLIAVFSTVIYIYATLPSDKTEERPSCSTFCPYSSRFNNRSLYFNPTHIIRNYPNFVCPQNFRNLADWIYGWPSQFKELLDLHTDDGRLIAPCLPSGSIIYVRIWVIDEFFEKVYPHLINDFVLITGEGDLSSPCHLEHLHQPQSKIIHWFGQNGQINVTSSTKFTHIPIGINCFEMSDAIEGVYAQNPNYTEPPVFQDNDEPQAYPQPLDASHRALTTTIPRNQLVLINFFPKTDKTGLRERIWHDFCRQQNTSEKSFARCITKPVGVQINNLPDLYQRNRQYPFWLSPRGNGLDCHRTWEALYLDIIPIVWNSTLNVLYENLPVLIINDHRELNETYLYAKLKEISTKKLSQGRVYAYEKLRNAYWRRKILDKSRHMEQRRSFERTKQCWRAKIDRPSRP